MPEDTPRLKLIQPSTGQFDWDKDWWSNMDRLDEYPGIKVITTATLPEDPWVGQVVYNSDTGSLLIWEGSTWIDYASGIFAHLPANTDGIQAGRAVYLHPEGYLQTASNTDPVETAFKVLGLTIQDIPGEEYGLVRRIGLVKKPDWGLTTGSIYYLGTDGELTETEPSQGFKQVIGVAEDSISLAIRISGPL